MSRAKFLKKIETELKNRGFKLSKQIEKIIWQEIGERDEETEICYDEQGKPEPDKELKDFERVPLGRDIYDYFEKEVKPYATDSWIDETVRDKKDGKVGIVGYEIPFTRYFYKYEPPRDVSQIEEEISQLEKEINELLEKL